MHQIVVFTLAVLDVITVGGSAALYNIMVTLFMSVCISIQPSMPFPRPMDPTLNVWSSELIVIGFMEMPKNSRYLEEPATKCVHTYASEIKLPLFYICAIFNSITNMVLVELNSYICHNDFIL